MGPAGPQRIVGKDGSLDCWQSDRPPIDEKGGVTMPRIRFLATLAIMPLTMLGWFPVMAASSDPEARPPCSQLGGAHIRSAITLGGGESALDPDIRRVRLGNDVWVERLTGKAALAHLHNIMSRRPGAFDRARQSLRDRGFVPTETVYVERTIRLASTQPFGKGLVVPAQDYSESNEDGEILFWSWDDGDDATWEGSIYIEIYSDGAASTWEGQIDASNEEHNWIYYLKTWEGGPGPGEPLEARFDLAPPRPGHAPRIVTADLDLSGRNPAL